MILENGALSALVREHSGRFKEDSLMRQLFRGPADRQWRRRACEEARMLRNQNEDGHSRVPHPAKS